MKTTTTPAQTDSAQEFGKKISPSDMFGVSVPFDVCCGGWSAVESSGFDASNYVPKIDEGYVFDPAVTKAVLAGFMFNKRVLVQGLHGTGKTTHIEQISARLQWPLLRINLDGHVTRADLLGRDMITVKNGHQVTEFVEGLLPWALQRPVALCFDEYDAGRPDVMFIIQRMLEVSGSLTLLDQNKHIRPHAGFRLFATANTVGLGDPTGLYQGTSTLNQGQMDRWSMVVKLDHIPRATETEIILQKVPSMQTSEGRSIVDRIVSVAESTRVGFRAGDVMTIMSPRTCVHWAENIAYLGSVQEAFLCAFVHRCDEQDIPLMAEYFYQAFGESLFDSPADGDAKTP